MNIIENFDEFKLIKKNYRLDDGLVCSLKTGFPIVKNTKNTVRLSTSGTGKKKAYSVRYIACVLSMDDPTESLLKLPSDIPYTLDKQGNIRDKQNHISRTQNKLRTMYRLTIEGSRIKVSYLDLVHCILKKPFPTKESNIEKVTSNVNDSGYIAGLDAQKPTSKTERLKRNDDIAFAKAYMKHFANIKSTYTAGVATTRYAGPAGDMANHSALFTKVKRRMAMFDAKGMINMSTPLLVDKLMLACVEDMKRQMTAWVELHKFKAKRGELNQY